MFGKGKKIIAGILCGLMLFGCFPADRVKASEISADQEKEATELLQYLYIESPYLETPAEENIVVSWGDGSENIEAMSLVCEKADGTQSEWTYTRREENLYLFSKAFSQEESGSYCFNSLKYTQDGVANELTLSELGIQAEFGVNEEYVGYEPVSEEISDVSSEEVENSVVTISEDNADNAEQEVETVLEQVESSTVKTMAASVSSYSAENETTGKPDNVVIALDPGHGGSDAGASNATYNANEKTLCLKIARYVREELESYGEVDVVMTRDSDVYLDLKERVDIAASKGADIFISLHLNAYNGKAYGAEVYYPNQNYNASVGVEGEKLAEKIQNEIVKLGLHDREIKDKTCKEDKYSDGSLQDYYGIIRYSKLAGFPGIIIEHAFIDNNSDYLNYLSTDEKLKKLGIADARGIANYLKLNDGEWIKDNKGWWYRYNDGSYPKDGWSKINGKQYYFDKNGYMATGWIQADGHTYYLNENGTPEKGWKLLNEEWYYFESTGVMHTGWLQLGNTWYYLESNGKMVTGWKDIGGARYYFDASGAMYTGKHVIDGVSYEFESSGALKVKNGWELRGNTWYYFENGTLVTGWKFINGNWYYFMSGGAMHTGWLKDGNTWYYLNSTGEMRTGWLSLGNTWYYLESNGKMVTGWKDIGGARYYFDASGAMYTGKHVIDGISYEFESSGALKSKKGWDLQGDVWYYYETDGKMATGWRTINGSWYYFASNGVMQTGWLKDGNTWYYLETSGAMKTGWLLLGNTWYYLESSGAMHIGWLLQGDIWYYLKADGSMAVGWENIDDYSYYFASSGAMYTGKHEIDGITYDFGTSGGIKISDDESWNGWKQVAGEWCYYNNGKLVHKGVVQIMGKSTVSVDQMVQYFEKTGKIYPAESLKAGGATTIRDFCEIALEEANAENVKAEVLFVQMMKETGWLQFGGDVKITQYNFGGLGAAGNGVPGESFKDVRTGIRAQVQHLKAYASEDALVNGCVDNRFTYVSRGCAPYVEWLGVQENPNTTETKKYGWAASKNYGFDLCDMITALKK